MQGRKFGTLYLLSSDIPFTDIKMLLQGAVQQGFSCQRILYNSYSPRDSQAARAVQLSMEKAGIDTELLHDQLVKDRPSIAVWEHIRCGDAFDGGKTCFVGSQKKGVWLALLKSALFGDVRRVVYGAGSTLVGKVDSLASTCLLELSVAETLTKLPEKPSDPPLLFVRPTRLFSSTCVCRRITCVLLPSGTISLDEPDYLTVESEMLVRELMQYGREQHMLFGEFGGPTTLFVSDTEAAKKTFQVLQDKCHFYLHPRFIPMDNPFMINRALREELRGRQVVMIGTCQELELAASFLTSNPEWKNSDRELCATSARKVTVDIQNDSIYEVQHFQVEQELQLKDSQSDYSDPFFQSLALCPKLLRGLRLPRKETECPVVEKDETTEFAELANQVRRASQISQAKRNSLIVPQQPFQQESDDDDSDG